MAKFKVGDIVMGTYDNRYTYTGAGSTNRVLGPGPSGNRILVQVIKPFPDQSAHTIGGSFWVDEKYFKLIRPKLLENE